jgi:hypothetical protein
MKPILLSLLIFLNSKFLIAGEEGANLKAKFEVKAQQYIDDHCHLSKADFNNYRKKYPTKDDITFIFTSACLADESGKSIDFVIDYSNKYKDGSVTFLASLAIAKSAGVELDEILKITTNGSVAGIEKALKKYNLKQELLNDRLEEIRVKMDLEPKTISR